MHPPPETEVIDLRAPSPAGSLRREASEPEVPAEASNEGTNEDTQPPAAVEGADGPAPAISTPSLTLTGPDLEFAPSTLTHEGPSASPSPPPLPEKDAPGSPVLTLTPANSDFALKMAMMGLRTPADIDKYEADVAKRVSRALVCSSAPSPTHPPHRRA